MGDYIEVCSKDVHIAQCGEKWCSGQLKKIEELLKKEGCLCVDEYKMHGLWKERFKENFRDSCYTIIHKCKSLWKLMLEVPYTDLTSDSYNKIMCVKLESRGTSDKRKVTQEESDGFFNQFNIQVISDGKSLTDFVQKFMQLLDKSTKSPSAHNSGPEFMYNHRRRRGNIVYINNPDTEREVFELFRQQLVHDASSTENQQVLDVYPDEFGQRQGREVHVTTELPEDFSAKLLQLSSIADLKQHIDKFKETPQTTLGNLLLILHKIIPVLYDIRNSIGLAYIVLCNQLVLQNSALTKLELLVLKGFTVSDIGKLQETELLLAQSLSEMSLKSKNVSCGQTALHMTMDRLCNLILMLHCQMISHSHDEIIESDSFNEAIRKILSETALFNKITMLINSSKSLRAKAEHFGEFDEAKAKELSKGNVSTQIFVIVSCLIKIFSRLDLQVLHYLTFLKKYLRRARWPFFDVPSVCLGLIFRGMSFFLSYSLRAAVHMDISSVCSEVLNVIMKAIGDNSCYEVNKILNALLFIKIPSIRQGVIHFFKRRKLYSDKKLPRLLLDEITNLLHPLLVLDPKEKLQQHEAQWWTIFGTFGYQKAIILFHKPSKKDHLERDSTRFIHDEDTMHQNQIMKLKKLRHPLIISLLAYQLSNTPQFYILEDYRTKNLQTVLTNRNHNREYFSRCTLIKFLGDAAEALEFCHRAGIVHRNLTAASLFIVGDDKMVKLTGFELAVTIDGRVENIVENGKIAVPTRWSAPESLRRLKFSKATDCWMFGHLVDEVLTHGVLPYSDLDLDDDVLVQKFFLDISYSSPVQLFPETCLKREHYDLIMSCANIDASERPDIATIKEQLCTFFNQTIVRDCKPSYPSLTDGKRQPSTSMKRGIPDVFSNNTPKSLDIVKNITSMLTQYQLGEVFIFQEVIVGHMPETLLSKIKTGSLDNIIPWIKINTSYPRVSVLDCYIPASCGFCLLDQTRDRALGSNLHNYMEVLLQIAKMLKRLHDEGFVLGDMCASTLFLEQRCGNIKIFVVSLAYISESNTSGKPPTNRDVLQRAAPEVKSYGLYSPASDVFCFGQLIREVVTAFDYHLTEDSSINRNDSNRESICELKIRLKELMDMCGISDMDKRPKMEELIDAIKRFIADLNDVDQDYASLESLSSQRLSSTMNKVETGCGAQSYMMHNNTFEPEHTNDEEVDQTNSRYSSSNSNTAVKTLECCRDPSYLSPVNSVVSTDNNDTHSSTGQFGSNSPNRSIYADIDGYNYRYSSSNTAVKTVECCNDRTYLCPVKTVPSSDDSEILNSTGQHDDNSTGQHDDNSITLLKKPACKDQLVMHSQSDNKNVLVCEEYSNDSMTFPKKIFNSDGSETEKKNIAQQKFQNDYDCLQFENKYDTCIYADFSDNALHQVAEPQKIRDKVFEINI